MTLNNLVLKNMFAVLVSTGGNLLIMLEQSVES